MTAFKQGLLTLFTAACLAANAFADSPACELTSGWYYRIGDSPTANGALLWAQPNAPLAGWLPIRQPYRPPGRNGASVAWFRIVLPACTTDDPVLFIPMVQECAEFYLDGKLIGSDGVFSGTGECGKGTYAWHLLPLEKNYAGKLLTLRICSNYRHLGMARPLRIDTRMNMMRMFLFNDLDRIVMTVIFLFLGFILLISLASRARRKAILGFCAFCLIGAAYTFSHSFVKLLYWDNPLFWFYSWWISVLFAPIGIFVFLEGVYPREEGAIFRRLWQIHLTVGVVTIIVSLLFDVNRQMARLPSYLFLAVELIIAIGRMILKSKRKDVDARVFLVGLVTFASIILFDIVKAFIGFWPNVSTKLHWGMFITILTMATIMIRNFSETYKNLKIYSTDLQVAKDKLQDYAEHLEDEVDRRTAQLRQAMEQTEMDLEMAGHVQTAIFQETAPKVPGWDIAFVYKPILPVSGDFYDFYVKNDELQGACIYDVSGHGVASGLITMIARSILYRHFSTMPDDPLNTIVSKSNRELVEEIGDVGNFVSGIILRFTGDAVEYVNAGHQDLLIKRKDSGAVETMTDPEDSCKGFFLGLSVLEYPYEEMHFTIAPGDTLLLYTDCLNESLNALGDHYGIPRIVESLQNAPDGTADEILRHLLQGLHDFTGTTPLGDDLTIIVMKRTFP